MAVLLVLLTALGSVTLLSFGVDAEIGDDGYTVFVSFGPWSFKVLPYEKTGKKEKKPIVKDKKEKDKSEDDGEKTNKLKELMTSDLLKKLLRAALNAFGRLRHAIHIDLLELDYTAGAPDVAETAIQYGYVNAALGALYPVLKASVRELDLRVDLDYTAAKPSVYVHIILSVALWEILYIGLAFVTDMLNMMYRER